MKLKTNSSQLKLKLGLTLAINFEPIAFTTEVCLIAKLSPNRNPKQLGANLVLVSIPPVPSHSASHRNTFQAKVKIIVKQIFLSTAQIPTLVVD